MELFYQGDTAPMSIGIYQRTRSPSASRVRRMALFLFAILFCTTLPPRVWVWSLVPSSRCLRPQMIGLSKARLHVVLSMPEKASSSSLGATSSSGLRAATKEERPHELRKTIVGVEEGQGKSRKRVRKKYNRKRPKPSTEKAVERLKQRRQAAYEQVRMNSSDGKSPPSIFSFEALFPAPVWDEESVQNDLYGISKRDKKIARQSDKRAKSTTKQPVLSELAKKKMRSSVTGSSVMRIWREPKMAQTLPYEPPEPRNLEPQQVTKSPPDTSPVSDLVAPSSDPRLSTSDILTPTSQADTVSKKRKSVGGAAGKNSTGFGLFALTRKVEESVYGYRRTPAGSYYDTSLVRDGAVQFRDGVRLGRSLPVNLDRLNYHAKTNMRKGKVEEAQELYEMAVEMDPYDGRAYLGLSRIAQRRRDFKRAKEWLKVGIANSVTSYNNDELSPDRGSNPFLLQALGCLEERIGNLSEAELLYIAAVKSRPSHAAAWVSLAQLRTRKLRQGAAAGRVCFQSAERELKRAGHKSSAHVYTAWASLEYKKAGDTRRARELFLKALDIDPKCSAAWLQLGVMESNRENWDEAQKCFETVLTFDQRNSRVLQAYALMETKRPDGESRKAIELFERALKVNPRDAGVLQPYALYCAKLGDVESARDLLRRGTEVDKRHAPVWQAWGVLETRHGNAKQARDIFQQGIWACAQLAGGQSGGRRCARLWQAWGVLEAQEGDYAAARRCFNRALDADNRNVATIIAWTLMEEDLGNYVDARHIFERALKQFPPSSDEKMAIWRAFEVMEQRAGDSKAAQHVYQRSIRESMQLQDEQILSDAMQAIDTVAKEPSVDAVLRKSTDFEVSRWAASSMGGEVWMNNGSVEGKVPVSSMKKANAKRSTKTYTEKP